ncbi:MAG: mechanosensitive ion channel [Rhodobacteraceae bacterium]|nr:mechanosensitive ion channel [Paracoccaceae bacterium]
MALLLLLSAPIFPALAQQEDLSASDAEAVDALPDDTFVAPVIFEGETLFLVRGSSALPADERADTIVERLNQVAASSESLDVTGEVSLGEFGQNITIDGTLVSIATDADAEFEQMEVDILAGLQSDAIVAAIISYREERSTSALVDSAISALAWTAAFLVLSFLFFRYRLMLSNKLADLTERRFTQVEEATHSIVQGKAVGALVRLLANLLQWIFYFVALYYYLSFVLLAFAETRSFAELLLEYVSRPLILIALVFAYPFIPGSEPAAFQGLTILAGLMISLGSNTVVSNMMAGLFVIYRRSTNVGDRIRVGDKTGDVVEIKLMETLIKSLKNEMISIPNAQLLNSEVINYSRQIDGRGLLVHTTVGIGYEEPPEKVKAMLIEAARRTRGIRKNPEPFVLWTALADYAINYQINAFTGRGEALPKILSDLHENIMTVFTENGTQIMTPSYEADPPEPKIPPLEWDGKLVGAE